MRLPLIDPLSHRKGQQMTYDVEVTRDGKWWMIAIPAIDGLTQTRRLADAEAEAIDYIAVDIDVAKSTVSVNLHIVIDGLDASSESETVRALKAKADQYEHEASEQTRKLARVLAAKEVPYRDIGTVIGISPQRAHQLATAQSAQ